MPRIDPPTWRGIAIGLKYGWISGMVLAQLAGALMHDKWLWSIGFVGIFGLLVGVIPIRPKP